MSDSSHDPSPKRRRVALACGNCRERKVRCDGARPVCGACSRRGNTEQVCEYLVVADTAKYQTERAYLQSLRDHIVDLQGSVQEQTPTPNEPGPNEPSREQPATLVVEQIEALRAHREQQHEQYESPASSLPHSISAMGTAVPETDNDARDQYYGQSSIVSLVQQCAQPSPVPFTPSTSSTTSCNASTRTVLSSFLSDDFSLPPRKTTNWLLDIYFTNSHLFYPWVHKESFLVSYEHIWSSNRVHSPSLPDVGIGGKNCPEPVFYCALNAILAIACEFSNLPSRDKRTSSLMFYERMKNLLNIDILDSGSLAHVQALLLVAIYLQCTPYPRRCWNVVGMAYRMSVGLGLHLSRHSSDLSAVEREMRWRAWCACVQMDIIVSMTMGRPAMTPNPHNVPLPSPIDDRYLVTGEQPTGSISSNQFLYENMRLIGILGNILSRIYHTAEPGIEVESTFDVDFQSVMEIDHTLEEFESSLHPAFQWQDRAGDEMNPLCKRQSNVLHARYLHLKLLLYRPAFSEHCSSAISSPRSQKAARSWSSVCRANCAAGCVRSACDLITSLAGATLQDATGAWWYGVFYLISAAIILVAAESSGAPFDGIDKDTQEDAWKKCLQTLHRMVDVHPSARDYAIALGGLKQRHASHTDQEQTENVSIPEAGEQPAQTRPSENDPAGSTMISPFLSNWDNGLQDIMLPAHWIQDLDEGLLLPNLF